MAVARQVIADWRHRRMCLSCGHRGRSLQGDRGRFTFSCPRCRADLYARPALSYAEMEGFAGAPAQPAAPSADLWLFVDLAGAIERPERRRRRRRTLATMARTLAYTAALTIMTTLASVVIVLSVI